MKVLRRNFHPHVSLDADFIVHPFSHISRFCLWGQLNWVANVTYSVGLPEQKLGTRCGIFGRFKGLAKLASIVCPTSVCEAWSLLLASFASNQLCMAKLASKHRTSNICLPTSKNVFDLNQKHFCLPTCKMCLPNMKCLKKLVAAKRASKDRKLKVSHVRQTMLVSFTRP